MSLCWISNICVLYSSEGTSENHGINITFGDSWWNVLECLFVWYESFDILSAFDIYSAWDYKKYITAICFYHIQLFDESLCLAKI